MSKFVSSITKHNAFDYLGSLKQALQGYIEYADKYGAPLDSTYEEWEHFKEEGCKYPFETTYYGNLAQHLIGHLYDIPLNVLEFCYSADNVNRQMFPRDTLHCLYKFRYFCYGDRLASPCTNWMGAEEQNERARDYVHFDFSVKRIKTLKDVI